jgi:hypothetical protein
MMDLFGGPSRRELQEENERVKEENERVKAESNRLQVRFCPRIAGMMYPQCETLSTESARDAASTQRWLGHVLGLTTTM